MPKQVSGLMHGYQLWVNLPRAHKMIPPRYQDIAPERFSTLEVDDARVRLVAGEIGTHRGPVEGIVTAPHMLDVTIPRRGSLQQTLPSSHNAFAYVIEGEVLFGDDPRARRAAVAGGLLSQPRSSRREGTERSRAHDSSCSRAGRSTSRSRGVARS
jgi:redox-sensitive bicupin YhaK (pirin superfamily)